MRSRKNKSWVEVRPPEIGPKEKAVDSDAAVVERLKQACYNHQGNWKKWLPFYGVIKVEEVNFKFDGVRGKDGTFPIRMASLDIGKIQEKIDKTLSLDTTSFDIEFGDFCNGQTGHSEDCKYMMDLESKPCILVQVETAKEHQERLDMLHLLTRCGRNPIDANGRMLLIGVASDTCIYNVDGPGSFVDRIKYEACTPRHQMRGLHFVLGWETERLYYDLPRGAAWCWLGVVVTWLCVLLWGGSKGDWSTAMAFGQLVAASVSVLVLCVQD